MRHRSLRRIAAFLSALSMLFILALQTAALDDKYRFDELKMSVRVPKDYYVVTRNSDSDDDVFKELGLDYDETMIAFENSDIWLQAYSPDRTYWISLIATKTDESKTIKSYSDISAADRKGILENLKSDSTVTGGAEVKHGKYIFFDTEGQTASGGRTLYFERSNTVVGGTQVILSLQKYDDKITPEESTVLTTMAKSLEFDSGPRFDWWRLLLWVGILAAVAVALSILYRHRNEANRRRLQERRRLRELALAEKTGEKLPDGEVVTFEEALGYQDAEQYENRAATDLDTYDIKVEEKNPMQGVALFEDSGESIDDGSDYFDTYFSESVETRKGASRFFAKIWTYIKIGFKRLGYFFKNLKRAIFGKKKH